MRAQSEGEGGRRTHPFPLRTFPDKPHDAHLHLIGWNLVTWSHLTTREPETYSLSTWPCDQIKSGGFILKAEGEEGDTVWGQPAVSAIGTN